jgi:ATP-binding cassette subfamily B protein
MHANTIFVLEKGSHAQRLQGKGLYYAMWRQQIGERPSRHAMVEPMEA